MDVKNTLKAIRLKLPKVLAITLFAFLLSTVMMKPFSFSASAFLSNPEKSDFAITDFYSMLADSREVREVDRDIAIIDLKGLDREGIARVLDMMPGLNPAAVGLDVLFAQPREAEADDHLMVAISQCPRLVLAASTAESAKKPGVFDWKERSFFADDLAEIPSGVTNFPTKYPKSTIREFKPFFPMEAKGDSSLSFATAVAAIGRPGSYSALKERGRDKESISFHSRTFLTFLPEEIEANRELLEGRILLLGDMSDLTDMHATPVTSTMSGVEIHANALSTIVHGEYLNPLSEGSNIAIALLLCFIIILMASVIPIKVKGLVIRLSQVVLLFAVVYVGYVVFLNHNIVVDFSYALLMIAFGMFANDIWLGGEYVIMDRLIPRYKSSLLKKHLK